MKFKNKTVLKGICAILFAACMLTGCGSNSDSTTGNNSQSVQGADNSGNANNNDSSVFEGELTEEALRNYKVAPESDFEYSWDIDAEGGGISINGYLGNDTVVVIPETIDGQPVTAVSCWDFANDSPVRGVYCPPSVQRIGAFGNNKTLEIVICEGVEVIEESAFLNCGKLHTVVLGDNLKELGDVAFYNCKSLTELYIAPSLTEITEEIYYYVFYRCDNLTIKGKAGSYIESVCAEQEIPFEAV